MKRRINQRIYRLCGFCTHVHVITEYCGLTFFIEIMCSVYTYVKIYNMCTCAQNAKNLLLRLTLFTSSCDIITRFILEGKCKSCTGKLSFGTPVIFWTILYIYFFVLLPTCLNYEEEEYESILADLLNVFQHSQKIGGLCV